MVGERLSYPSPGGQVPAYLVRPDKSGPSPGLLVIHENEGLTPHIEDVANRFSREGYLALALDLFASNELSKHVTRQGLWDWFAVRNESDSAAAIAHMEPEKAMAVSTAAKWWGFLLRDAGAAIEFLRGLTECSGRVGSIGYCMGGSLSGELAATGADLQACVIYYGGNPPFDQLWRIRCPIQGHYGAEDQFLIAGVPLLIDAMRANGKTLTTYIYEGAPHAFFNDQLASYRAEAAALSWQRTTTFLASELKSD